MQAYVPVKAKIVSNIFTVFLFLLKIRLRNLFFDTRPEHLLHFLFKHCQRLNRPGTDYYITILLGKPCHMRREVRMKSDDERELKKNLKRFRKKGVDLYLEGSPASPEEIARKFFVCEEAVYMPDFVVDDGGRLKEVRYDRIAYR